MKKGLFKSLIIGVVGLYIIYFLNNINITKETKIYLNIIIGLIIAYSIYKDIVLKIVNTAGFYLVQDCDLDKAKDTLNKIRKIAFFSKARQQIFILDCYIALDGGDKNNFQNFIDNNSKNYLLKYNGCNITFEYVILSFFFFNNFYSNFKTTYEKLLESNKNNKKIKINSSTLDFLEIEYLVANGGGDIEDKIAKYKKEHFNHLNNRSKAYFYLLCFKSCLKQKQKTNYLDDIKSIHINIPFIKASIEEENKK